MLQIQNWVRKQVWNILRGFLFRLDAETAHQITVRMIRMGIYFRKRPLIWMSGAENVDVPNVRTLGMDFRNRVGLAAGFDKNAELLEGLPALGFGFAEIGTVTPRPQAGNPRPRLFRDVEKESIFNRMGFNGLGATLVSERVRKARPYLPPHFRVGINLGKNKDTPNDKSNHDYVKAAQAFEGLADYLVINVSSPNTPGLRSLQTVEALKPIVSDVMNLISGWKQTPPLLLKIAPELGGDDFFELVSEVERWGMNGWILTNTLAGTYQTPSTQLSGGWSGKVLTEASRASLVSFRRMSQKPVISVGGIFTPEEAKARVEAGAQLIQIYTGWIYQGPAFPAYLAKSLH